MSNLGSNRKCSKELYKNIEDAVNRRRLKEKKTVLTYRDVFDAKVKEQSAQKHRKDRMH